MLYSYEPASIYSRSPLPVFFGANRAFLTRFHVILKKPSSTSKVSMASSTTSDAFFLDAADESMPSIERTFRGHRGAIRSISFNPNLKQMASSGDDSLIIVWNFNPRMRAFKFSGHTGPVHDVVYAPSGRLLASASKDRTVRLWQPNVKGASKVIKAHSAGVRSVQFSSDERLLLTASDDKTVKLFDLKDKRRFKCSLMGHLK